MHQHDFQKEQVNAVAEVGSIHGGGELSVSLTLTSKKKGHHFPNGVNSNLKVLRPFAAVLMPVKSIFVLFF